MMNPACKNSYSRSVTLRPKALPSSASISDLAAPQNFGRPDHFRLVVLVVCLTCVDVSDPQRDTLEVNLSSGLQMRVLIGVSVCPAV
jgi:hypothetical protein